MLFASVYKENTGLFSHCLLDASYFSKACELIAVTISIYSLRKIL